MSKTLSERARSLRADLEALSNVRASAGEAGVLTGLRDSLEKEVEALKQALASRALLAEAGLAVPLPAAHEGLRKRAQTLRERFEKDPRSEALKKGQVWRNWLEQAEETAKAIRVSVRNRWQSYEAEVFAGDAPQIVEKLLAPTSENKAALRRYRSAFEELRSQFRVLPASDEDIALAKLKANELKEIAKAFDFDVPADVKAFLEAVFSGGAPLSALTPSVIDWLKENGTYGQYRVSALRQA